ncbi:short tail fiber [Citrobacter phage CkP1]|nr:short tail fiber [Citrobacter phage CkP1]
MISNTLKHISDESKYVVFNPENSSFDSNIIDVQHALESISLDGVNGVPLASVSAPGKIQIATQQEVDEGIIGDKAVTPATLASRMAHPEATTTVLGLTQYATNTEAIAGVATNRSIVASALKLLLTILLLSERQKKRKMVF